MENGRPRIIRIAHHMPGRTRVRLSWLRHAPEETEALATYLSGLDGMLEVEIQPRTGSVLCLYHPADLDHHQVVSHICRHTGVDTVVAPGEVHPSELEALERAARQQGAGIAREVARVFRTVNVDLLRMSNGRVDLPIATALALLSVGAVEIVRSGKLPAPPWFNLAWWAFRTFATMELKAIASAEDPRLKELETLLEAEG